MRAELKGICNDLNKAYELKEQLNDIKSLKTDPITEIIQFGLNSKVITSSLDILEISQEIPMEVAKIIAKMYDKKISESKKNSFSSNPDYMYAGVYKSLDELNTKFGTDFNNRCIPAGVVISSNGRC